MTGWANAGKSTACPAHPEAPPAPRASQASQASHASQGTGGHHTAPTEGDGMANKIEIRPLDKKETTGDSGGNGGA
ncbi:hypothetical protein GCM10023257_48900 [Streptomyces hyderabadensis]|uniref:Uncharacterized protein n=1 Tax=Streptomyces hyderabadensis TaxID=598549 RepID=A0ABP9IKA8_9ACTN